MVQRLNSYNMEPRCETDRFAINRQQLGCLLASLRSFQDSISTIINILQEPSKGVYHQSCPRDILEDSRTKTSLALQSSKGNEDDRSHDVADTPCINVEAPNDFSRQHPGVRMFEVENARARKLCFNKQNLSFDMYNRAGASHLSREYHFQCKRSMSFRFQMWV